VRRVEKNDRGLHIAAEIDTHPLRASTSEHFYGFGAWNRSRSPCCVQQRQLLDSEESDELPTLADMPAHLETITDVDELKALKRQDTRKGGKELIQARIDALKSAE
jgi:hypothetical protein